MLKSSSLVLFLILIVSCLTATAHAGGDGERCLLIVNADNADSVTVAQEYAGLRKIPAGNVVQLSGLPASPVISVADFRRLILQPVLDTIRQRGLEARIDYLVYSCGFPYGVDVREDMADKKFPRVITQPASLTGLTYFADLVLAKDTAYLSLDANWYARPLKRQQPPVAYSPLEEPLAVRLQVLLEQYQASRKQALQEKTELPAESAQWLDEAITILQTLLANHQSPELLYDLACVLALQGKADEAMTALQSAYRAGWWNAMLTEADTDLKSLRERGDFKALVEEMRQIIVETEPAQPFRRSTRWARDGKTATAPEGRSYYLSAMLGYVGEKANTLAEVLQCLRTSAAADGTCPSGTIYYMVSTDWARTGPRQWAFKSAIEALGKLGVKGEILEGVLPPAKQDVAGAVIGIAGFSWPDCGSRILPGAFCDHLTSFGGVMTGAGQTVLSEFIRHGAAGACGTVTEPYALPAKFPSPFMHVYYASGCTLAEAFYQSVHGPYQQLLVGDPLCRPWVRRP